MITLLDRLDRLDDPDAHLKEAKWHARVSTAFSGVPQLSQATTRRPRRPTPYKSYKSYPKNSHGPGSTGESQDRCSSTRVQWNFTGAMASSDQQGSVRAPGQVADRAAQALRRQRLQGVTEGDTAASGKNESKTTTSSTSTDFTGRRLKPVRAFPNQPSILETCWVRCWYLLHFFKD